MSRPLIAPCGIDCSTCHIYRAKHEPEIMKDILDWFRNERKKELSPEQVRCGGCLGDRASHWSADCDILQCSVDNHKINSCSECGEFPCDRLGKFAQGGPKYAEAVDSLREMKAARGK
ncbi:MAG: DUF3795 domain-containing protein [Bacillota bacterium]